MISPAALAAADDDAVAFDLEGKPVLVDGLRTSSACLVLDPISDALKLVDADGWLIGDVDRANAGGLIGFIVSSSLLKRIDGDVTWEELITSLEQMGIEWEIRASFGP